MQDRRFFTSMAAALFLMAGFTSCTNDELEQKPLDGRTPINLTSSVATRSISQNIQDTQIANGVQVGVFAQSGGTAIENGDNNALTADGNGAFSGTTMYFPEEGDVSIYAYAPYNQDWAGKLSTDNEFTVKTDQSSDADYCASDLMIGVPSTGNPVSSTTEAVQLNFKHKLTKLNINFNVGQSGVDLKGATVKVKNVKTTATVNVQSGTATESTSSAVADITAAVFNAEATTFTASVIFVPQTITTNAAFVEVATSAGSTFTAPLSQEVAFEGGKKYTYTAQFTGGGDEPVEMELKVGSVVDNWEDALLDQYAIGDYITKDGQILKSGDITADNMENVRAVIFSKEVSSADAALGYNAYAMSVDVVTSKKWGKGDALVLSSVSDFSGALADLDGLSHTESILTNEYYTSIPNEEKGGTIFEYCQRADNLKPVGESGSNWFVPSIGQMIQIINNLGGAKIASNTEVSNNNMSSPIYYADEPDIITAINAYATAVGRTKELLSTDTKNTTTYVTSTEYDTKFWCLQTNVSVKIDDVTTSYKWGFGKNAGKSGSNRVLIPCVAVTLPAASLY